MIRAFREKDITSVMQIWLEANMEAHGFVAEEYWKENYEMVKEILPQAEVYVYEDTQTKQIQGFIGVAEDHIEGLFVKKEARSRGIGKQLLDHVKSKKEKLSLGVYRKNEGAIHFYRREQFVFQSENTDEDTGEKEWIMSWSR